MARQFYYEKDELIASGSRTFYNAISQDPGFYGLTQLQVDDYLIVNQAYLDAYRAASNRNTRTSVAITHKDETRRNLQQQAKQLSAIIRSNPNMDGADFIRLGILPPMRRVKREMTMDAPAVALEHNIARMIRLRIYEPGKVNRRTKPEGVFGANVFLFVGEQPPTDRKQYEFMGMTPRAFMDIRLPNSVPSGATIWVSAHWVNKRGEIGTGSNPISFTIQGGAISAA